MMSIKLFDVQNTIGAPSAPKGLNIDAWSPWTKCWNFTGMLKILQMFILNKSLIEFSLHCVPEGVNDYKSTLDHMMVWPRLEENPLPVPMMTMLWVNPEGSWPRMMCAIRNVLHPAKLCVFLLFCRYLFCSSGMECKTNLINTVWACQPSGHYWDYYHPVALYLSQVATAT